MIGGAFIAGSSPEGSAAVAYPVFTLFLKIAPGVTRNFAFAIQSIGMTCASVLILNKSIKVEWNYIKFVTLGGLFGMVFGTFYVVPLISPPVAKLFFVSLWLSFGIVLWNENRKNKRDMFDAIRNFGRSDIVRLIILGLIGGMISSIFGTGINIFSFCFMTIYYRINEKVAIPSSVIIMTIETIFGFFIHAGVVKDFQKQAFEMWLICIPFVAVFAPLGSYVISKVSRKAAANFLSIILVVQFIGAMYVLKPVGWHLAMSLIVLASGLVIFALVSKIPRRTELSQQPL
ncbi:putative membrane protein YfcA [Mucilaginibacter lappiensis]|uniref:Probable membrane transporter protein n=1 Tax=Mucilaginibacter lappiensis TaxID=354630 RepID=A0ABR6PQE2_9SPHI|nr:sulfite exporter TauE/SafE family protein [Mucilaginibacter lappiensis]MBB6111997.1 putative membrane protein YfcA [Mucilaginibacter lappiensis]